jgi:trk system potassium uptake protein TrkA
MRFVIVGAGRVGSRTARVLREEGHEVTAIERDPETAERLREAGFEVLDGDGSREEPLEAAGIDDADALGALTGDLNVNFAACMIAKHRGCRTVMRIDADYREEIYEKYAADVDEVVYPERLGAIAAKNALLGGNIRAIADIAQNLQILLITVTEESPMRGYSLSEVELPARSRILAFGKAGGTLDIPLADDSLESGDQVAVLADFDVLDDVRQLLIGPDANGDPEAPAIGGGR